MITDNNLEIEIKIEIGRISDIKKKLLRHGFKQICENSFEHNIVFDTKDSRFKKENCLLRLRNVNNKSILTFKKPPSDPGISKDYKVREELEIDVSDFKNCLNILTSIGFEIGFMYEKYREVHEKDGVKIMIDRTPIGNFIEIEGMMSQIDTVTNLLGFSKKDYIVESYYSLFKKKGRTGFMLFK